MNIFAIISSVFGVLLLFGFLIGVFRSWKKSLIRFAILIVDVVISLFVSPAIVKAVIKKVSNGTTLSIFNFNIDFSEIIENFVGGDMAKDIISAESTTNQLATSLINIVVNVVMFFVIFISLWLLSLIIYGIISLIVGHVRKKDGEEKTQQHVWQRLIGGFVGFISMCVIAFALLIPVFGAMNICNQFLKENSAEAVASARSNSSSYIAGNLYYTEDEKIGKVETYIEKYSAYKEKYDRSFVGGFFNITGIGKLGGISFKYLTTVSSGELNVNLTDEMVVAISTYNAYKETFVENDFDIANNTSVDRLISIYDNATRSKIISSYMVELIPTMAERWTSGEKFLGIASPITGEYEKVGNELFSVFKVKSSTRIDSNIKAILNLIKVANNNNLISAYRQTEAGASFDVTGYLSNENTLVKDVILTLSTTQEFRNSIPTIFNELLKILYDDVVGGENPIKDISSEEISQIDWNFEAENLQNIVNEIIGIYNVSSKATDNKTLIQELGNIGKLIDYSRQSKILSRSLKEFIIGYINSDKLNIGENSDKVKETLTKYIDEEWDNEEFSFEDAFATIGEAAMVIIEIKEATLDGLQSILDGVILNEDTQKIVLELMKSDIVENLVGTNENSAVVKEVLIEIISETNLGNLEKDIAAGEKIIDIVNSSNREEKLKDDEAREIVETLAESKTIMGLLEKVADDESSHVSNIADKLDSEEKDLILQEIENSEKIDPDKKLILNKLFGK